MPEQRSDKITIEALAKMFGLPDWDRIDELNQEFYWEQARGAEGEDAAMEAERAAQDEVFAQWYDAVEHVADKLFAEHGLELVPVRKKDRRSFELRVVPIHSWKDAADKIRETVNGAGPFYFHSLREFLNAGPYTARQAVLSHLGWIKHYPAVYGGLGPHQMYENAWR